MISRVACAEWDMHSNSGLCLVRKLGLFLRRFPQIGTDVVALLDEWAVHFFEELDYVHEVRLALHPPPPPS